jgi:hypothetical protein
VIRSRAIRKFDPTERLYCTVATAIVAAGAAGAGASIWGANTAANAQTSAANAAIANQKQMYGNNQQILSPFISGGASAIPQLQALLDPNGGGTLQSLLGLTAPGPNQNATLAQTPGYQFSLQQGQMGVNNALAARGLGGSGGAVAKGAAGYAEGLAGNTWQSVVQALQGTYNSQLSGTQNLINSGEAAGGALAGVGTNTANSITGSLTGAGNAQAAAANTAGGAISNLAANTPTSLLLSQLLSGGANPSGGIYGNSAVANAPATGPGSPSDFQSNMFAISQGINPF